MIIQFIHSNFNYGICTNFGVKLIPQTTTVLDNEGQKKAMEKLIDLLEDDDDVQNVYHNWEITD